MAEVEKIPHRDDEKLKRVQARVRRIKDFYHNLITFVIVNLLLLIINLIFSPHSLWFYWVTLIWGFFLFVQAINTFTTRDRFLGEEWEERKIREIMEKERNSKGSK